MRLDKYHEQELAQRKGLATRTIVQAVWLLISAGLSYLLFQFLFSRDYLSYDFFYETLGLPRSIDEWMILAACILIMVIFMQFFLILGYAFASPTGRQRPGTPSAYSSTPDPLQDEYRN